MKALNDLAERVERAEGPDRNLDAMIHHTILNGIGTGYAADAPAYTASLDAAMTLISRGFRRVEFGTYESGRAWAYVHTPDDAVFESDDAPTEAAAITAAALRSQAQGQ